MAIIRFQEARPVVSDCLSLRNSGCKRRHGEGGKVHKKCVWWGGGGFKTGARLRDAANGRKQKFLSLVKELRSIRYPVTSPSFVRSLVLEAENIRIACTAFRCFHSVRPLLCMIRSVRCVPRILEIQCSKFNTNTGNIHYLNRGFPQSFRKLLR